MLYAKSKEGESIQKHTDELLKNLNILKEVYGKQILENTKVEEKFWELVEIACTYHDVGKAYTPFQNIILEKLGKDIISTNLDYKSIKHEQLSPMFIPTQKYELSKEERQLIYQAIFYHHERTSDEVDNILIDKIIQEDIEPNMNLIKKELDFEIKEQLSSFYLKYVGNGKRIKADNKLYIEYCLLKGMLNRLDHSSSANIKVEDTTSEELYKFTQTFMQRKGFENNALQEFCQNNQEKNIIVIGSTGMGKTEAALLWSKNNKAFFTLPIRVSINAIYDRINELIGYKHVGLLHSTALDYLEEKEEFENQYNIYEQSKNLASKVTTCTIDQIFTFVFKYKGYEKMYATLSYSKVIIDEIQGYSPEIVAVILKGIEMITQIGGKFMIMTATLPRIYKEELKKMGVEYEYGEFLKDTKRHKIKLENKEIIEDCKNIKEKSKDSKVLIIANTINKAIEIYKELEKQEAENINLLHSRFILEDRNKKENKIKLFSNQKEEKGIWITTQIVEASLDIDFDYLYTEMSTLDSLFQRLGRCYRSREYKKEEPNIHIYNQNATGIGYVYDKDINEKSIELLGEYDNQILTEEVKVKLVDKLYSKEMIQNTGFYKKFKDGMTVLNNITDYNVNKTEAQKLLRNIENITVMPRIIYDKNLDLLKNYNECKNYYEKNKLKRKINKLTTSISKSQEWKLKEYITKNPYIEEIKIIDLKYNENVGLILEKDEEYELDTRMC